MAHKVSKSGVPFDGAKAFESGFRLRDNPCRKKNKWRRWKFDFMTRLLKEQEGWTIDEIRELWDEVATQRETRVSP